MERFFFLFNKENNMSTLFKGLFMLSGMAILLTGCEGGQMKPEKKEVENPQRDNPQETQETPSRGE